MRTETTNASDRRGDDRRPVDLLINRFLNGYPYLCRATDISRSGMRMILGFLTNPSTFVSRAM